MKVATRPAAMTSAELAALVIITNGTLHALPPGLSGCHFSPLDHQLYYVYSQMLYDESFEMSLADKPLSKTDISNVLRRAALAKRGGECAV